MNRHRRTQEEQTDVDTRNYARYTLASESVNLASTSVRLLELVLSTIERGEAITADHIAQCRRVASKGRTHIMTARTLLAVWKATLPQAIEDADRVSTVH